MLFPSPTSVKTSTIQIGSHVILKLFCNYKFRIIREQLELDCDGESVGEQSIGDRRNLGE